MFATDVSRKIGSPPPQKKKKAFPAPDTMVIRKCILMTFYERLANDSCVVAIIIV